ncbi:MAG: electron transfer flavoprotein subunit beta/FixA family protein [Deltaproteobacteria bacterium]|nr:electron transfer flavoprotein subunit beta/FixA family protein [Deltaproteobacteria bacterium]
MKIMVLLKQTPPTEAKLKPTADGRSLDTGSAGFIINPYDEFAIEEALRIREQLGAGEVVIASFGPADARERILRALAMGADRGLLISHDGLEDADSLTVAKILAAAIRTEAAELVLCGKQAIDDDNMHTGVMTAEILDWPHVNVVTKMELDGTKVRAERETEGGRTELCEVTLPAVFGAHKALNTPRYVSVPGVMKARKKPLEQKNPADFGLDPAALKSSIRVLTEAFELPPEKPAGRIFRDEAVDVMVDQVVRLLREEAKIL